MTIKYRWNHLIFVLLFLDSFITEKMDVVNANISLLIGLDILDKYEMLMGSVQINMLYCHKVQLKTPHHLFERMVTFILNRTSMTIYFLPAQICVNPDTVLNVTHRNYKSLEI